MIVCSCHGVSDRLIKTCIEDGAHSVGEVSRQCQAGGDCGACHGMIDELIAEHQTQGEACSHPRLRLVRAA